MCPLALKKTVNTDFSIRDTKPGSPERHSCAIGGQGYRVASFFPRGGLANKLSTQLLPLISVFFPLKDSYNSGLSVDIVCMHKGPQRQFCCHQRKGKEDSQKISCFVSSNISIQVLKTVAPAIHLNQPRREHVFIVVAIRTDGECFPISRQGNVFSSDKVIRGERATQVFPDLLPKIVLWIEHWDRAWCAGRQSSWRDRACNVVLEQYS